MIDVAVIGAGLGGLATALYCARGGLDVQVFERGGVAGGFACTWTRGPYTFEGSLHALDAVGVGQPNRQILDELGVSDALELLTPAEVRNEVWPDGRQLVVPRGRDALIAFVAEEFGCRIDGLLDRAQHVHEASHASLRHGGRAPGLHGLTRLTGGDLLREHVTSAGARTLLGGIASWQGAPVDRIAALNLLLLLHGYHVLGGRVPRGGSASLVRALVSELERLGGRVHLGRPVTGVTVSRRRVTGIEVGGEPIRCRHVVAAIAPQVLVQDLLPARAVPSAFAARLRGLTASGSLLRLTAGVSEDPGLPYETLIRGPRGPLSGLAVTARHVVDPSAAPPGTGVLSVSTPWPAGDSLTRERKAQLTDLLIDTTERALGVSLRPRLTHTELAHPGTFARFAGVPGGSVFGHPPLVGQTGGRALGASTPIPHLWMAGAWVFPGPGQTASLISGRLAAHRILQACGQPAGVNAPASR